MRTWNRVDVCARSSDDKPYLHSPATICPSAGAAAGLSFDLGVMDYLFPARARGWECERLLHSLYSTYSSRFRYTLCIERGVWAPLCDGIIGHGLGVLEGWENVGSRCPMEDETDMGVVASLACGLTCVRVGSFPRRRDERRRKPGSRTTKRRGRRRRRDQAKLCPSHHPVERSTHPLTDTMAST